MLLFVYTGEDDDNNDDGDDDDDDDGDDLKDCQKARRNTKANETEKERLIKQ